MVMVRALLTKGDHFVKFDMMFQQITYPLENGNNYIHRELKLVKEKR